MGNILDYATGVVLAIGGEKNSPFKETLTSHPKFCYLPGTRMQPSLCLERKRFSVWIEHLISMTSL